MLKPNQMIYVRWSVNSKEHYENLGYICNKITEPILVKAEDIYPGSHVKVQVICDYCNKTYEKNYADFIKQHNGGDCCSECMQNKAHASLEEKYGEDYMHNLNKAFKDKYGVSNPMEVDAIKEKVAATNLQKYGVTTIIALPENNKKATENSWSSEAREKRKSTNLQKYGTEWGLQSDEIRTKIMKSYSENGSGKISKPQLELYNLLKDKYGECYLNYPCSKLLLDCVICVDKTTIDIEYDGIYWHQDEQKDRHRDEVVKSYGYKVLRISGSHKLPDAQDIYDAINTLLTSEKTFIRITTIE